MSQASAPFSWQMATWQRLVSSSRAQRLAHALLFTGPVGSGKTQFVQKLAQTLLCERVQADMPCGACQSCLWFEASTHPHVLFVEPDSKTATKTPALKVDDVRERIAPFVLTKAPMRVVVFSADLLNHAASNALLKILEEPPTGVQFLLTSSHYTQLMATVLSRVQRIDLSCHDEALTADFLKQAGVVPSLASELARLEPRAPLEALRLSSSGVMEHRELWLKTWTALLRGSRDWVSASEFWQAELSIQAFLNLSRRMIAEVKRVQLGLLPEQSVSVDAHAKAVDAESLEALYALSNELEASLRQNANEGMLFDRFCAALAMSGS